MIIILVVVFILLMITTFLSVKTMLYMREHNNIVLEEKELQTKCCFHEKHDCNEEGVCVSRLQKRCGQLASTNCVDPLESCETMSKEECMLDKNKRVCEISVEMVPGGVFCTDVHFNKIKKYPDKDPIFYLRRDRETVKLNSKETYVYLNSVQDNE